ncbi:hypothetical protein TNCV_4161391 [Trichonephila clavipes]|nr:hypothetical protein TNCV_4161391 [Trichonephila clavipes]
MGSRIEIIDLPIKKCAGVNTSKLSKSLDIGVRGLEFKIPSTWIITVSNSSYVSRDLLAGGDISLTLCPPPKDLPYVGPLVE